MLMSNWWLAIVFFLLNSIQSHDELMIPPNLNLVYIVVYCDIHAKMIVMRFNYDKLI